MKKTMKSVLYTAAACALTSLSHAGAMVEQAAPMAGVSSQVAAMPVLGPEFGFTISRDVQSFYIGGAGTVQVKEITPPDVAKLEAHAGNAALPEDFRAKAVQTIATLSMNQPAIASLERIATKDPTSKRMTEEAIAGLGGSQHPEAEAALKRIIDGQTQSFQKTAAMAALKNIADTKPEPDGYW